MRTAALLKGFLGSFALAIAIAGNGALAATHETAPAASLPMVACSTRCRPVNWSRATRRSKCRLADTAT